MFMVGISQQHSSIFISLKKKKSSVTKKSHRAQDLDLAVRCASVFLRATCFIYSQFHLSLSYEIERYLQLNCQRHSTFTLSLHSILTTMHFSNSKIIFMLLAAASSSFIGEYGRPEHVLVRFEKAYIAYSLLVSSNI